MGERLRSILCREPWSWDFDDVCHISFEKDGTGELIARSELCIWIAAEIEWTCLDPKILEGVVSAEEPPLSFWGRGSKPAQHVAQFDIDITLTKRRVSSLGPALERYKRINEELLADAAFAPKTYTVRLEQGAFPSPSTLASTSSSQQFSPPYKFKLVFDRSPYPPEDEWKDTSAKPQAIQFWEWKEFCSRKLPENMNKGSVFGCISS